MPIDFSPPSGNLQGYQITSPQSVDPLQTLAQMGQLRTQNLQRQGLEQENELNRARLDSQKGMLKAMVDSGGDDKKFQALIAQPGYNILPGDAMAYQEHQNKLLQDIATRTQTENTNRATNINLLRGLYNGVKDDQGVTDAHSRATQLGIPDNIPRYSGPFDAMHLAAFSSSLAGEEQQIKEAQERAATEKEKAQTGLAGVQTTEAQQKVDLGEQAQIARELQNAPTDDTGRVTPAAMAEIQKNHSKAALPLPTKEAVRRYIRSTVPADKLPEYDINTMKADLGLMGNTEFDQYQLKYAQSLGKKPNELTFPQFSAMTQQYAKDRQDPAMLALIMGVKGSQQALTAAQVSALPSDKELEAEAKDYRNLDMPPGRIAAMREGRISYFPQILQKAREQAAAEGQPFSPATLEAKYDTWLDTEKKFASGGQEAALIRGFENLMRHTALGYKAKDALAQNDLPLLKRIANGLGVAEGKDAGTTYDLIAGFIADEAAKAFLPGGGGESERAQKLSHLDRGLGTKQLEGNYKGLMELADSQRQTLEREYAEGTFGKGPRIGRLFSADALASRDLVLGKKPQQQRQQAPAGGTGGKKITVIAGDGSTHPFDTEAQAKIFEDSVKAAGGTTRRQ